MNHVAIMRKQWELLERILEGRKTVESRWMIPRRAPWSSVRKGDAIYFKNSGESVTARARVGKVLRFSDLTPRKVLAILHKYGAADGISAGETPAYFARFKNKKYCVLIFLRDVRRTRPFMIDKTGFGAMAAWISVPGIRNIKVKP